MLDGVACRIGLSVLYAYVLNMGVTGFFLGNATARVIPGILGCAYFLSGKWKTRKLCLIVSAFDPTASAYFWGAALCQLVPGLIAMLYFLSGKWKTKKLLTEA